MRTHLAFVLVLASVTSAAADDNMQLTALAPHKTLGIDGIAVLPLGNYADAATVGIGALARLEIPVSTGGWVTGRAGVIAHQVNSNVGMVDSLLFIPIYAGYRHPIGTGGAYLAGELGITFGHASASSSRFGGRSIGDSDSELGVTLSAGLRRGALDLRAGLFAPDIDDVQGLMGSVGFDFAAL